ncbi:MAG: DNA-deoxyinosine glycosylase [Oscillospiraceae bacterium]|nr:DNA-deoxyinosine glycosylase [Oscillospiraceae bacterium]
MKAGFQKLEHGIDPVFDERSRVLVLGSFPSARSREQGFFYGHARNRFWAVLAGVFCENMPESIPEKKELLLRNRVALWDVIAECEIRASSDSSIKNARPNDLSRIIDSCPIERVLANGAAAAELYKRFCEPLYGKAVRLPSTSPANAAWSLERLIGAWGPYLEID